jgi:hypothetical protein
MLSVLRTLHCANTGFSSVTWWSDDIKKIQMPQCNSSKKCCWVGHPATTLRLARKRGSIVYREKSSWNHCNSTAHTYGSHKNKIITSPGLVTVKIDYNFRWIQNVEFVTFTTVSISKEYSTAGSFTFCCCLTTWKTTKMRFTKTKAKTLTLIGTVS